MCPGDCAVEHARRTNAKCPSLFINNVSLYESLPLARNLIRPVQPVRDGLSGMRCIYTTQLHTVSIFYGLNMKNRSTLPFFSSTVTVLALCITTYSHADFKRRTPQSSADHYAAIWSKQNAGAWVARHGLSADAYQSEFNKYAAEGYRLASVDGYEVGGQARYAAIWRKTNGPAWVARHGLSSADYQAAFDKNAADGYRLTWVNGYTVQGQAQYAAIWEKSGGPAWVARHGLNPAQYQSAFDEYTKQGYRLELVSGYAVGNEARYAAIWRKTNGAAWVARHGLSGDEYQAAFDTYNTQGYHLTHVSGYKVGGKTHYAAIWDKGNSSEWVARHGMNSSAYQQEFDSLTKRGYSLDRVSGY